MLNVIDTRINGTRPEWIKLKSSGFNIIEVSWWGRQNRKYLALCQNQEIIDTFTFLFLRYKLFSLKVAWLTFMGVRSVSRIAREDWKLYSWQTNDPPTPRLHDAETWDRELVRAQAQRGPNKHVKGYLDCCCTCPSSDLRQMARFDVGSVVKEVWPLLNTGFVEKRHEAEAWRGAAKRLRAKQAILTAIK